MKKYSTVIIIALAILASVLVFAYASPGVRPTGAITWSTSDVRIRGSETTATVTFTEHMTDTASYYTRYFLTGADERSETTLTIVDSQTATLSYSPADTCTTDGTVYVWFTNGVDTETETIVTTPTAGGSFVIDVETPTASLAYNYSSTDTVVITATMNEAMSSSPTAQIAITGDVTVTANMTRLDSTRYYYILELTTTTEGTGTVAISGCKDSAGNTITASAPTNPTFPFNDPVKESSTANDVAMILLGALGGGLIASGAPRAWKTVARKR